MKKLPLLFLCTSLASTAMAQSPASPISKKDIHKVQILQTLQTTNYTYLQVQDADSVKWLAVPIMTAEKGEVYYYAGGWPMVDFESKELKRKFDKVLFLGSVSKDSTLAPKPKNHDKYLAGYDSSKPYARKATADVKLNLKIDLPPGAISIKELLANKEKYAGKKVIIKGQVTKYSEHILGNNWIHLQDGTDYNGKFDLTITTKKEVKNGDIITLEGMISLNKDLSYGYNFDVIMEDALLK